MLELTCQEARRCRNIVTNLLGFARKKKPQKTYLNANDVCRNTLNLLSYHFKVNNVKLVTHLAAELPYTMADEHQLQQVLVNILSNAYQAMAGSQDGECLTVVTTHDGTNLAMQISDTGPGIAPENLYRIFDPFFTTKETGTGLGMSLSYGLIKAHGGEITVASEPGEGATFTIVLPILDEDDGAPQPLMVSADAPCPRQKVLVLDDEPKLAQMLVAALRTMGHQATSSTVSPAALEALDQDAYDLVICDLKMPGADGPQVYQFLQRQHPEMLPRLIFSSGDTVSEKNQEFLAATGCLFLPKPFLLQELKEVVARAVHRRTLATVQTAG
jgi:two-component system NtrC family sensor kinase